LQTTPRAALKVIEPNLQSATRAEKRKEFNEMMNSKIEEKEKEKESMLRQKLEEEMNKIKEFRRKSLSQGGCTFRATPVMTIDPMPVKGSSSVKQLTQPISPKLRTAQRAHRSGR
jgi:hypothetical protein